MTPRDPGPEPRPRAQPDAIAPQRAEPGAVERESAVEPSVERESVERQGAGSAGRDSVELAAEDAAERETTPDGAGEH